MLSEGNYGGRPLAWGTCGSSKAGSPQIWVEFQITCVADGEKWKTIKEDVKRTAYWSLQGGAFDITTERLEKMGWNGDFGEGMALKADETYNLVCLHETYQGKPRERWDLANMAGPEKQALDTRVIRELNAKYRAKHPTARGTPTPTTPQQPSDAEAPEADVPF